MTNRELWEKIMATDSCEEDLPIIQQFREQVRSDTIDECKQAILPYVSLHEKLEQLKQE